MNRTRERESDDISNKQPYIADSISNMPRVLSPHPRSRHRNYVRPHPTLHSIREDSPDAEADEQDHSEPRQSPEHEPSELPERDLDQDSQDFDGDGDDCGCGGEEDCDNEDDDENDNVVDGNENDIALKTYVNPSSNRQARMLTSNLPDKEDMRGGHSPEVRKEREPQLFEGESGLSGGRSSVLKRPAAFRPDFGCSGLRQRRRRRLLEPHEMPLENVFSSLASKRNSTAPSRPVVSQKPVARVQGVRRQPPEPAAVVTLPDDPVVSPLPDPEVMRSGGLWGYPRLDNWMSAHSRQHYQTSKDGVGQYHLSNEDHNDGESAGHELPDFFDLNGADLKSGNEIDNDITMHTLEVLRSSDDDIDEDSNSNAFNLLPRRFPGDAMPPDCGKDSDEEECTTGDVATRYHLHSRTEYKNGNGSARKEGKPLWDKRAPVLEEDDSYSVGRGESADKNDDDNDEDCQDKLDKIAEKTFAPMAGKRRPKSKNDKARRTHVRGSAHRAEKGRAKTQASADRGERSGKVRTVGTASSGRSRRGGASEKKTVVGNQQGTGSGPSKPHRYVFHIDGNSNRVRFQTRGSKAGDGQRARAERGRRQSNGEGTGGGTVRGRQGERQGNGQSSRKGRDGRRKMWGEWDISGGTNADGSVRRLLDNDWRENKATGISDHGVGSGRNVDGIEVDRQEKQVRKADRRVAIILTPENDAETRTGRGHVRWAEDETQNLEKRQRVVAISESEFQEFVEWRRSRCSGEGGVNEDRCE